MQGLLALFGLSRFLTLLELRLLLSLDVGNGEDQPNAAGDVNTERKREGVTADVLFVAKLPAEGDLICASSVFNLRGNISHQA